MEINRINSVIDPPAHNDRLSQVERREENPQSDDAVHAAENFDTRTLHDQVDISQQTKQPAETEKTNHNSADEPVDRETQEFAAQNWYAYGFPSAYGDFGTVE